MAGHKHVCPWWLCFTFDNPLRRLIHNPEKILGPYVKPGDNVIDVGAGMGYFSIPLAKLVGPTGHVTSIDIQPKMLSVLSKRAQKHGVSERISTHLASPDSIGHNSKADLILAFWMVHEVPEQQRFLKEICGMLKPDGQFLVVEPRIHVPKKNFFQTLETAKDIGFFIKENPKIRMSRSAILTCSKNNI